MRLRRSEHATRLTRGTHDNIDLQEDFDKYGMDYFEFIPMMTIMTDIENAAQDLNETEAFFIDKVCVDSFRYYNRVEGGGKGSGVPFSKKDKSLPLYISKIENRGKMYYIFRFKRNGKEVARVTKLTSTRHSFAWIVAYRNRWLKENGYE